jgi:bifunctional UDP-N-acetylglucosamine pyrophosphorylase/glucosamine-1-phosphate N-acetyltransferase
MTATNVKVLILAGGKGKRLGGNVPKVLHEVAGKPIIDRVLQAVTVIDAQPMVVVGHEGERVEAYVAERGLAVWQREQLGTGDAVAAARELVEQLGVQELMVVPGDHPFIPPEALLGLLAAHREQAGPVTMASLIVPHFTGEYARFAGFGRVVRAEDGTVAAIVEVKDATPEEAAITEVNVGYYCFDTKWLFPALAALTNDNQSGEYYLTDVVAVARQAGAPIAAYSITDTRAAIGVNTPEELESAERVALVD